MYSNWKDKENITKNNHKLAGTSIYYVDHDLTWNERRIEGMIRKTAKLAKSRLKNA